jgi:arylsulfatase A-like enzyme
MKRANVFWISIDSLRRDFLHIYNPAGVRRTYLDDLAEQGCIFENAFPGGNWTMPSHASMLTGLDATSHMIWSWKHRFAPGTQTAFDFFHRAGYTNGCFAIPQLRELFTGLPIDHMGNADDPALLKCFESSKPFFAFWHTYNVHYPYGIALPKDYNDLKADYDLPSRTLNYIRHLITSDRSEIIYDSYRREIGRVARFIQGVSQKLKKLGKLEETYFIITADHGEAWEPQTTFHCNFQEEVLRVPLFISGPGISPSRVSAPISQINLLPTVLQLCELAADDSYETFDGETLLEHMRDASYGGNPVIIAGPNGAQARHRYLAVRQSNWMLITAINHWTESLHYIGDDGPSINLLDRPLTPEGHKNLEEFRAIAERHAERFLSRKDHVVELSSATEKKLRALGYV